MNPIASQIDVTIVPHLAAETRTKGFAILTPAQYLPLVQGGLAEVDMTRKDINGSAPVRFNDQGLQYADALVLQSQQPITEFSPVGVPGVASTWATPQLAVQPPQVESSSVAKRKVAQMSANTPQEIFTVIKSAPLEPVVRKPFVSAPKYPFEQLDVNDAFDVPNTAERPDAVKTMLSAVAAANRRYSEPTGEKKPGRKGAEVNVLKYNRKFEVRALKDVTGTVVGARVGRTA